MKVVLSVAGFMPHSFGGGEIYAYRLAKELQRRDHRVVVLTRGTWDGGKDIYEIEKGKFESVSVFTVNINPKSLRYSELSTGFGALTTKIIRNTLSELSPDIIHINGLKSATVTACNDLKIPYVVTAHHMGIACPSGGLLRSDYSICNKAANCTDCVPCCSIWRAPKWYTGGILGRIPPVIYRPMGEMLNNIKKLPHIGRGLIYPWLIEQSISAEKKLLEEAGLIIAPSMAIRELLIRNGCGASKIILLPHGIEPLKKSIFETFAGRLIRFGYVGRIDPLKGLHILLKAMERLSNGKICELHIFGASRNPWDEEYRSKTLSNYNGKAIVFDHGLIAHEKLDEAYASIDILVVPSVLPEAFGLVVAEAFSAGRPVIVMNSGALPEIVRDGVDGFVVERNDSEALAEAMQKFIDNPDLIIEMSRQILPVKTIHQYVDEVEKIYHQLISTRN
jgi:glycosyltransferase involved in cell wall biosynthesis